MNRIIITLVIVIIMVAGYLAISTRQQEDKSPVTVEIELPPENRQTPTQQPTPPAQQFPVPATTQAQTAEPIKPLPTLDESDQVIEQEFSGLVNGDSQLAQMFLFKTFVRNFVVIIDNLTAAKIPQKYQFVKPPAGTFLVRSDETGNTYINPENHARYLPFVRMVAALDTDNLVNVYVYLYPLFQQAYEEMGFPDKYFNDRLVEVIDHLLLTPEVADPVALVQPKVYYHYADPDLEARSAGQKLLMRVGKENADLLKRKLQDVKAKLTSLQALKQ
jgi:hypothetical protein